MQIIEDVIRNSLEPVAEQPYTKSLSLYFSLLGTVDILFIDAEITQRHAAAVFI